MINIKFLDRIDELKNEDTFLFEAPSGISSKSELLLAYGNGLKIPDFGLNWDALDESLNDLSWLDESRVIIYHSDIPKLEKQELEIFFNILNRNCYEQPYIPTEEFFAKHGVKIKESITFFFPAKYKEEIESFLIK